MAFKYNHPSEWLNEKLTDLASVAHDNQELAAVIVAAVKTSQKKSQLGAVQAEINRAMNPVYDAMRDLLDLAKSIAGELDGDQIQELFQAEMAADGYFTDPAAEGAKIRAKIGTLSTRQIVWLLEGAGVTVHKDTSTEKLAEVLASNFENGLFTMEDLDEVE